MSLIRYSLIGVLVAAAFAASVALVIRSLPDREPPPAQRTAEPAESAAPAQAALEEDAAKEHKADEAEETAFVEAEAEPPTSADSAPTQEAALPPRELSTMQGRALELLAIPPAGTVGPVPRTSEPPAGPLRLSREQEERLRYVLSSHNIMQAEAPEFPLRVGNEVPANVPLSPLPIELADVVPNYQAYSYLIAQDRIVIVITGRRVIGSVLPL